MIAGAVLAAGSGTRMGQPKATIVVDGVRLVDRAVTALRAAGCAEVVAVVRAHTDVPGALVVVNPEPDLGLRSSLTLAVQATPDADAIAVVLVDMPGVGAEAIRSVTAAWRPGRVAVARYGDESGHPIVMSPQLWRMALTTAGPDEGARQFLATHGDLVDEVAAAGERIDLDTPEDLLRFAR